MSDSIYLKLPFYYNRKVVLLLLSDAKHINAVQRGRHALPLREATAECFSLSAAWAGAG